MTTVFTRETTAPGASNQGAPLTNAQLDANFINLNNDKEPTIAAGTVSQYLRGDKSWRDFFTDVRAATLTGLSTATNAVITSSDTVLSALGRLQKQTTDILTTLTSHIGNISNPHGVTKTQVGLSNVDNTSDANKPVSTATQTALNGKVDKVAGKGLSTEDYTTAEKSKLAGAIADAPSDGKTYARKDAAWTEAAPLASPSFTGTVSGITKAMVGLSSVDNTSDADKPISTATQTALDSKVAGVASSVDSELALFSGTGGKTLKRAAFTGLIKSASGVASVATPGTDYVAPGTETTFTAQQTFKEVKDTVYTITDGNFSIDPANGSIQVVTIGAARTPTAANFEAGQVVMLGVQGNYAITWSSVNPTWVKAGGTAAAPAAAATGYLWVLLWKVGTTMYASEIGKP